MSTDVPKYPVRRVSKSRLSAPFLLMDWYCQWIAYWAGNLAIFRVLEYAGKLTVLVALILWVTEIPERNRTAIRTAWSVLNGPGGGRKDALEFLVKQGVDLNGLHAVSGYFAGIDLKARDVRWSDLTSANFDEANLFGSNLRGSQLKQTSFRNAILANVDFRKTFIDNTNFEGAVIAGADFTESIIYRDVGSEWRLFGSARGWKQAKFDDSVLADIEEACKSHACTE